VAVTAREIHLGFEVDKLELGQVFLQVRRSSPTLVPYSMKYHLGDAQWARWQPQLHRDMIMIMILLMGLEYVSELRSPTDLFFIPQVIHGHGEPWLNNIGREN
jgi:hypothetical protein